MSDQATSERIATQWFAALERGDINAALALLATDVEWVNLPKIPGVSDIIPWLGTCHGVKEVLASFRTRDAVAEAQLFKPGKLVVQGDQAFGTIHDVSRIKATGATFDIEFATWMQIQNGKIVKWKSYCDPSPIIAAFRYKPGEQLSRAVDNDHVALVGSSVSSSVCCSSSITGAIMFEDKGPLIRVRNLSLSLAVGNLDATAKWYHDNLGFEIVQRKDFAEYATRIVFMEVNGFRLELIEDKRWKPLERPDPPAHTTFQGVSQIAFFVDNIEEVIKKVQARKLRVAWQLITVAELRMKEFFVRDNEGNIVQFIERY